MLQRYERAGIDLARVDWLPVLPRTRLLALYHLADVVLDSYYASGCTTTREALEVSTPRSRRDRAEIAPRSRRDRAEVAPRSRRDRAVAHARTPRDIPRAARTPSHQLAVPLPAARTHQVGALVVTLPAQYLGSRWTAAFYSIIGTFS